MCTTKDGRLKRIRSRPLLSATLHWVEISRPLLTQPAVSGAVQLKNKTGPSRATLVLSVYASAHGGVRASQGRPYAGQARAQLQCCKCGWCIDAAANLVCEPALGILQEVVRGPPCDLRHSASAPIAGNLLQLTHHHCAGARGTKSTYEKGASTYQGA